MKSVLVYKILNVDIYWSYYPKSGIYIVLASFGEQLDVYDEILPMI